MDIADSISIYFNFGKGHYFVLKVKQHLFGKARIFQMNRMNPAVINWREKNVETCARRSPSFENFIGKTTYVIISTKYFTLSVSAKENPDKTQLTSSSFTDPLYFASLCRWPLSVCFQERLRISFSRCSSLGTRLFTYALYCSLSCSSCRILHILASF